MLVGTSTSFQMCVLLRCDFFWTMHPLHKAYIIMRKLHNTATKSVQGPIPVRRQLRQTMLILLKESKCPARFAKKKKIRNSYLHVQTNQDCPPPHLSNIKDLHTANTHQVLTRPCFVDGRYVEYEKDAGRATLNPPMRKQTGNMFCQFQ